MSNRPAIPAEITREILLESGHRCAVCGTPCPLERAHIIPWRQSREHKAEDLICLCANCHERADREKWGKKTLREYKQKPWVMRQYENTDSRPGPATRLELMIEMEVDDFNERNQRLLQYALAAFLEIQPNAVQIVSIEGGSVKVTIELPTKSAEKLLGAYKRNDLELDRYLAPMVLLNLRQEEAECKQLLEQPTKVLLVDGHALFRQGVRNVIERKEEFEVVGEAEDGAEALAKVRELKPDLILMDINMPHGNSLDAVSAIKRELPDVRIIMLTVHDEDENFLEALNRGAEGFLSKNVRAKVLLDSLRDAMRGKAALSGPMTGKVLMEFARLAETEAERIASQLTPREKQVLQKMSEELTNREIAHHLCISENTVKTHVFSILKKLHIQSRAQVVAYARRWGLQEEGN